MVLTSRKRSLSDMRYSRAPSKLIDEEIYRTKVLGLPTYVTEEDIDERLSQEAHDLGLMPAHSPIDIEGITSSLSATTVASHPDNKSLIISQSPPSTSCSSSERRPATQSSYPSEASPTLSAAPSILSELDTKRDSGFRKGIRKMTGFRKRRSAVITSSTLTSINSDMANTTNSDRMSTKSDLKSPGSIKSSKSSWSNHPSATKSSYEQPMLVDNEAIQRSMDCEEMLRLQARQLEEKMRFLEYQRAVLTKLRTHHQSVKAQKIEALRNTVTEATEKIERAVEDLEGRQLEEEMKMVKEFEIEKRTVMVRLRHMEAYCQNPTAPPAPIDPESGRPSQEGILPERKVTDKDYHNLAQQYRERDAMDNLHASKINVLRGKQKKAVENFILKKEREIEAMERQHTKEVEILDEEAFQEENAVRMAFGSKRAKLELRCRLQAQVERTKMEKITGLKHASLPDVVAVEDQKNGALPE